MIDCHCDCSHVTQIYHVGRHDRCHVLTQACNFGAETHLGAGVMSAFVFLSATIAQVLISTSGKCSD